MTREHVPAGDGLEAVAVAVLHTVEYIFPDLSNVPLSLIHI